MIISLIRKNNSVGLIKETKVLQQVTATRGSSTTIHRRCAKIKPVSIIIATIMINLTILGNHRARSSFRQHDVDATLRKKHDEPLVSSAIVDSVARLETVNEANEEDDVGRETETIKHLQDELPTNTINRSDVSRLDFPVEPEFDDDLLDEDDERDEDEEDFYTRNPLDVRSGLVDFDDNDQGEIKVDDADFKMAGEAGNGSATNESERQRELQDHKATYPIRKRRRENLAKNFENRTARGPKSAQESTNRDRYQVGASTTFGRPPRCALVLARGGCITFTMVEWALQRARQALRFRRPAGLNSPEPSEATINAIGELVELATHILAARFQLTWDEIAFELEQIDISQTSLWSSCPAVFRTQPTCSLLSRYRTHTGQCNNLIGAHLGSSNMPFVRILPPDYSDGIGAPRRSSSTANELPPVRLLALSLHPDIESPSVDHSALFMAWGQLINHDLALASGARVATGHSQACCPISASLRRQASIPAVRRLCMPIQIGANDPVYSHYRITCQDFKRSLAGLRPGCSLGPRTQMNLITSYIDASFVYGSSRTITNSLRGERGQLETWDYFEDQGLKALLPPQVEQPDEECVGRRRGRFCFRSGDSRTNQQVQLVVLHTIHTRQHNRIARALARLNPHWTDNRIYHEARHIHIALVQHILIDEYLPTLLGQKLCAKYNLTEKNDDYWDHYDPLANPGISQAFAAAAFRQGHTTVPSQVFRFSNFHEPRRAYQLRQLFRQPWALYEPGAMDEFLIGMVDAPAQTLDPFISNELSGHLLETPSEPVGLDLTAINLQRGRDQGLASYNEYRHWCGLGRAKSFRDLKSVMSNRTVEIMASLYESVDDIDLFSAGISEFPLEGSQLGPTFACIIGRQFQTLRAADRFWFETSLGPQAFSLPQLASIKQVTLARLICANSDGVVTIQQWALHTAHPVLNPRVPCDLLPDLDLTLWLDLQQDRSREP